MTDLYQHSHVDTAHYLQPNPKIREELGNYEGKIQLVLPSLYDEIKTEAMHGIREKLPGLETYLGGVVVVLNGPKTAEHGEKIKTEKYDFDEFREFFSGLPFESRIIWDESDGIKNFYKSLEGKDLSFGKQGKGKAIHLGNGYALGTGTNIIAHHDCDIVPSSYDPEIVDRLVYPVAFQGYEFAKGIYGRYRGGFFGRVERVFLTPIIQVLLDMDDVRKIPKAEAFLRFLESIRYKLSGENAESASYCRKKRTPWDWAIEIGELADSYKICGPNNIIQVEIMSGPYDHKHQSLSKDDPDKGLRKMTTDIYKNLIRDLMRKYRVVFTDAHFRTIREAYIEKAYGLIHSYEVDAKINGIPFNLHEEKSMIDTFVLSMRDGEGQIKDSLGTYTNISSWERILEADHDALDRLVDAVESDNKSRVI